MSRNKTSGRSRLMALSASKALAQLPTMWNSPVSSNSACSSSRAWTSSSTISARIMCGTLHGHPYRDLGHFVRHAGDRGPGTAPHKEPDSFVDNFYSQAVVSPFFIIRSGIIFNFDNSKAILAVSTYLSDALPQHVRNPVFDCVFYKWLQRESGDAQVQEAGFGGNFHSESVLETCLLDF